MSAALIAVINPAQAHKHIQTRGSLSVGLRTREAADAPPAGTVELYRRSHALVIGIDDYRHWSRLSNAIKDAESVAAALTERGFAVQLLRDPNRATLEDPLVAL